MRAPGMTWSRLPLFIWAHYATSIIQLLGTPVVADHASCWSRPNARLHLGIFDPKLGGDPLLFQHLFWFYSHPAVYIMILPSMGVVTEIIACFSRKRIFGYNFVAFSSIAIAVFGFLVWAHHMFVAGISVYSALVFSLLELCRGRAFGRSKSSTGRRLCTRARSTTTRPCSTPSASSDFSPSAASPDYSWPRSASTSTSPTLISWSPTSTTSWWEARSWAISAACISGGRKFPAGCIPKAGRAWPR